MCDTRPNFINVSHFARKNGQPNQTSYPQIKYADVQMYLQYWQRQPKLKKKGTLNERIQVQPWKEKYLERQRLDRVPPGRMDLTDVYSKGAQRYVVSYTNQPKTVAQTTESHTPT